MAKPRMVDNVDMSFTDEPVENTANPEEVKKTEQELQAEREKEILGDNPIIFEDEGKRVYAKNRDTGEMLLFDRDGKETSLEVLDRLEAQYTKYPDRLDSGAKKSGDLIRRFTKESYDEESNSMKTKDVSFDECDFIFERQNYVDKDGKLVEAKTHTIPKKHYSLVKLLRDEIGQEEKK